MVINGPLLHAEKLLSVLYAQKKNQLIWLKIHEDIQISLTLVTFRTLYLSDDIASII